MVGDNESYDGHDELTGLPDLVYFSTEFERRKLGLKRSGESNLLLYLHLHDSTPDELLKEVADYWKETFTRTCRYEEKDYVFLALDRNVANSDETEQKVLDEVVSIHNGLVLNIKSVEINGDSGSIEEVVEQLNK